MAQKIALYAQIRLTVSLCIHPCLQDRDVLRCFSKMISRIKRGLEIRRQTVFFLTSPGDMNMVVAKKKIELMNVTSKNVDLAKGFRDEIVIKTFYGFLKEGQYGLYAKSNGKVVGHAWAKVCREHQCRVNGYMDISEGEAFIHYCRVSEYHRGNNIYPAMLIALCHRLFHKAGVKCVIIDTVVDNSASLSGIRKVGFKPLGTAIYFQFCGRLLLKRFKYCWKESDTSANQKY